MGELYRLDFPNGKSYIGMTTRRTSLRISGHRQAAAKDKNTPLYNAWKKHGEPVCVVLAVVENFDLPEAERKAINIFGTLSPGGYNVLESSAIPPMAVPEISSKIKGNCHTKGRKLSEAHISKIIEANKGRKFSKETLSLMKAAQNRPDIKSAKSEMMRKNNPMKDPEIAAKQGLKMRKPKSEEHKAKCRKAIIDAWKLPEFREKQSKARIGKSHSEETIEKMKISQAERRRKERESV